MTIQRRPAAQGALSTANVQYLALLAAGLCQFLLLIGGGHVYRFIDNYAIIPPILFLGSALTQKKTKSAMRQLLLCLLLSVWFILIQTRQELYGVNTQPVGFFFCSYLLALPFAALSHDSVRQRGFRAMAVLYLTAAMTLVVYAALLLFDRLPDFFNRPLSFHGVELLNIPVYWDGARLWALWHPNTLASILMIGVALSLAFCFGAQRRFVKCLMLAFAALQFIALALTHSRTVLLLTCALLGGAVFFRIWQGGRKRFFMGLLAALPVMLVLFLAGNTLYDVHYARLSAEASAAQDTQPLSETIRDSIAQTAETSAELVGSALVTSAKADELKSSAPQGSFSSDLKTLNGRTAIWKSALWAILKNPSILLFGTDNPGLLISGYNPFTVWHSHNSWLEVLLSLGLFGLLGALVITWMAVRSALCILFRPDEMFKKCVAMLVLCFLAVSIMEPYLFFAHRFSPFFEFFIFLCIGYLTQWRKPEEEEMIPSNCSSKDD